jgi:hypothetical protein
MKKLGLLLFSGLMAFGAAAQTARLQVIHNSPDAAAATVDIYVNGNMFLDDVDYKTASPFVDVPAAVLLNVGVAPGNSTSVNDTIANFEYTLTANETYIIVAQGIVSATGYSPATPFDLAVYPTGREAASTAGNTDVLVVHGVTDAPTVNIVESEVANTTLASNLSYNDFAGYLELANNDYVIDVELTNGDVVFAYEAPLQTLGLADSAITVLASGFLDPSVNSGGDAFGLFAVLPSGGDFIPLPQAVARLQVIHNSADALAQAVDIYLNGDLLIDDFAFRTASAFIDAPANVTNEIAVAPAMSTSASQAVATVPVVLDARDTYVAIANGIISPMGYSPATPFSLDVYDMGREEASTAGNTDVLVFHGSTDAPTVDVVESGVGAGTIVDDLAYGDFQGYLELATADYVLDIALQSGDNAFSYNAPLQTLVLEDEALVVVASGFVDPSVNSNGPAFGLWVALPAGGDLVELPASTARLQVIHNSADMAAATVDVYLNGDLLIPDFDFRTATTFIDAPANVEAEIAVAPGNSNDVSEAIATIPVTLENGETYIAVANGNPSASGYVSTESFGLSVYGMAREAASDPNNTDVLVHHGATDAPVVDVNEVLVGAGTIVDNLAYEDFQGYLELANADYELALKDETNTTLLAQYQAPLQTLNLAGEAITVVASGFLDPSQNSDGAAFGLWVALAAGGDLVELPGTPLSVDENATTEALRVFPNPVMNGQINVQPSFGKGSIILTSIDGKVVMQDRFNNDRINLDVNGLNAGYYMLEVRAENGASEYAKISIVR